MLDKLISIYKAFFLGADIPKSIHRKRINICLACQHNSNNNATSVLDKIRSSLFKQPFCTICGCQIYEKTSQGREVCALKKEGGYKPLWNRVYVKLNGSCKMNIINLSPDKINVGYDASLEMYDVDLGEIDSNQEAFEFKLKADFTGKSFKSIKSVGVGCGSCIKTLIEAVGKRSAVLRTRVVNIKDLGEHSKYIYVVYVGDKDEEIEQEIRVRYKIV